MTFLRSSLAQSKLILTLTVLLAVLGLVSWQTMIRQEDPRLPDYFGQVQVRFPGADAETVERLVIEPIEEHLAEVEEVQLVDSASWAELALLGIDLREDLRDTDPAWDRVRRALAGARREFPEGVGEPVLDDRIMDTTSVVFALTGSTDPLALAAAAERLERQLLAVPGTARVETIADPGEQITIELDDSVARRLGLTAGELAAQLAGRSRILPGGSLRLAGQTVRLRPRTDFESIEEIRATPVRIAGAGGAVRTVPLSAVADVRRGPEEPARFRARHEGRMMVGVGAVPRREIHLVDYGERVRERVAAFAPELAPIEVEEIAFQPARVAARLSGLARSLLLGAAIVAGVLVLFMGLRLGLVVTAVVPMVTLSSLAIYNLGGGVLHQISIAALVIALGMLVDNGIVVSESIQWGIDRGLAPGEAARRAVGELVRPLASATATTLAAFIPMLLSRSTTGDFTRAIPVVVMLTLVVSFLFAMLVTPILGRIFLRPGRGRGGELFERLAERVGALAVGRPVAVLLAALVLVGGSLVAAGWVDQEFFPGADRNQFVVELRLPEGTHLDATDAVSRRLERVLLTRPEVTSVSAFVGRSAPRFYYNLEQVPWSPHFGQILVETTSLGAVAPAVAWVREHARLEVPDGEVVVRTLEQGPPVAAPVELRLYGEDLPALAEGVETVLRELRRTPGAVDVRHSLSTGAPLLRFEVDDAAAARHGLSRVDVASALYGRTRGLPVGQYRADEDPVPVVVRSSLGEELPVDDLAAIDVAAPGAGPVPLAQIARIEVEWRPAAISHRGGRRVASVYAQLEPGATYSDVIDSVMPRVERLELPPGVEVVLGGAAEEAGDANAAIVRLVPVGLIALLGILLFEFRSFRRVALVLVTVPLAAAGVVPGLLLGDQPFGFMSTLGVIALVGVVVNNAIVLLEVIESGRAEGAEVPAAVRRAVKRRLRPILLTTATTVAGLLPLALSASSLWPPMAWALISGLSASTVLTLLVVPALYLVLFSPGDVWRRPAPAGRMAAAAGAGALALLALAPLAAAARAAAAEPAAESLACTSHRAPTARPYAPASAGRTSVGPPRRTDSTPAGPSVGKPRSYRHLRSLATDLGETYRLGLAEAMRRGAARPRVEAATRRAGAAAYGALAERRAGRWPALAVGGGLSERDRAFTLATPFGTLPFQPARAEELAVTVAQPLLEPARQLYAAPAARAEAESAALAASGARQMAAAAAAEAYLDVLAVDAASASTASLIESLESGLAEAETRVAAGRWLAAEALKVSLALDAARQTRLALAARRAVAVRELGRAVGAPGPVEPDGSTEAPAAASGAGASGAGEPQGAPIEALLAEALELRSDLGALRERMRALGLRRKAIRAERLPALEASASWIYSTNTPFEEQQWVEAGLALRWAPWRSGTVAPRAAAAAEELAAAEADYREAVRAVELQIAAAGAEIAVARGALEVGERAIAQAAETLRVERERYRAGRVTTNDLLDAEAALSRETTRRDVAALDLVRARVRLALAVGRDLAAPERPAAPPPEPHGATR